ncbi:MAG: TPM domain-containing protein [bacterium]
MNYRLFIILLLLLALSGVTIAQVEIPILHQRVTDFTNTLSFSQWKALESLLQQFEDSTSNQLVIVLIPSLLQESIEDYTVRTFEKNQLGLRGKNNGVLMVIAKNDRIVKIEVGYGLEGVLTDALSSQIIEREIKPSFRNNDFHGGMKAGAQAIIAATAGEYKVERRGKKAPLVTVGLFAALVLLMLFLIPAIRSRRKYMMGSGRWSYDSGWGVPIGTLGHHSSGGGSGWNNGGGWTSGGGDWSGGGGMSGGGGATGSW